MSVVSIRGARGRKSRSVSAAYSRIIWSGLFVLFELFDPNSTKTVRCFHGKWTGRKPVSLETVGSEASFLSGSVSIISTHGSMIASEEAIEERLVEG